MGEEFAVAAVAAGIQCPIDDVETRCVKDWQHGTTSSRTLG
jgi:hypothetical protein